MKKEKYSLYAKKAKLFMVPQQRGGLVLTTGHTNSNGHLISETWRVRVTLPEDVSEENRKQLTVLLTTPTTMDLNRR